MRGRDLKCANCRCSFPAVNASNTVLNVFEVARNMFYRHEACLMYSSGPALFAFTWAEIPFILLAAMVFVVPFYFLCGFALDAGKFFLYYLFIVLTIGLFTFNGQVGSLPSLLLKLAVVESARF